jgi:hypothetical protein
MYIRIRCLLDVGFQSEKECGMENFYHFDSQFDLCLSLQYSIFSLLGIVWAKSKLLGIGLVLSCAVFTWKM